MPLLFSWGLWRAEGKEVLWISDGAPPREPSVMSFQSTWCPRFVLYAITTLCKTLLATFPSWCVLELVEEVRDIDIARVIWAVMWCNACGFDEVQPQAFNPKYGWIALVSLWNRPVVVYHNGWSSNKICMRGNSMIHYLWKWRCLWMWRIFILLLCIF